MNRLRLLASLAKHSHTLCDIGCDHAYALVMAIEEYGVKNGIAADIRSKPLENALRVIEEHQLEDKIQTVLSDGFKGIDVDFDAAILSGMGGSLICDILDAGYDKIKGKKLIIEANCDAYKVREYLFQHHFKLTFEKAIYDKKKYYEVMVFEEGDEPFDMLDIQYGKLLRKNRDEAFIEFYTRKKKLLEEVILNVKDDITARIKQTEINQIESILEGRLMEKHFIKNTRNYYTMYFIDEAIRPTVIISPGGGYKYTSLRESEPVALAFNKKGYHAVVINYREEIEPYPYPGDMLASAINEISKDKRVGTLIGVGFSAGGHCILEAILHSNKYKLDAKIDLLILGYPVITAKEEYSHKSSFEMLVGNQVELLNEVSLETQIGESAPELFLWGTYPDESVPVMNSILLLDAYRKANINAEYHCFCVGGHGLSLSNKSTSDNDPNKEIPYVSKWFELACSWLELKLQK